MESSRTEAMNTKPLFISNAEAKGLASFLQEHPDRLPGLGDYIKHTFCITPPQPQAMADITFTCKRCGRVLLQQHGGLFHPKARRLHLESDCEHDGKYFKRPTDSVVVLEPIESNASGIKS